MSVLAALSLLITSQADTVLLLHSPDPAWIPFEARLVAELMASGFEVRTIESQIDTTGDIPQQLWQQCNDAGALAALWFNPRDTGRVDAWVADRVTAKAVLRTYEQPASGAERARLALRAVELLHASLLEVRLMPQREVPDVARDAVVRRFAVEPEKPHWVFGTGVGGLFLPGHGAQPMLELQLGYAFTPKLSLEAQGATSVFPTTFRDSVGESSADVGVAFLRAVGTWTPLRAGAFSGGILAAIGATMIWASGVTSTPGYETKIDARVTSQLTAGVVGSARLVDGVRLQLLATVGACVPEVQLNLGVEHTAKLGPIIDALVRLEFE